MRPRDNPFRVSRTDALEYVPIRSNWEELLSRLETVNPRGTVTGPKGTGKTTFLLHLARTLEARGFSSNLLTGGKNRPGEILWAAVRGKADQALLLDSAEKIPGPAWLALRMASRKLGAFVAATHQPRSLPVLLETRATPEVLVFLVEKLTGKDGTLSHAEAARLLELHEGNIRNVFRYLYDIFGAGQGV